MSLTERVWNGRKKVALGRKGKVYALTDSPLTLITDDKIEKFAEDELGSVGIEEVCSISNIEVFQSCLNCNRKLIQVSGELVSQCDNCGHAMKLSKCQQRVCMSFVIEEQEDQKKEIKTLTVFQEQLLSMVSQDILFDKPAIQEYFLMATGIGINTTRCHWLLIPSQSETVKYFFNFSFIDRYSKTFQKHRDFVVVIVVV